MSTELFRVGSIDELVAHRDRALELVKQAVDLLTEAQAEAAKAAPSARTSIFTFEIEYCRMYGSNPQGRLDAIEVCRRAIDSYAWAHLRDASGIQNLMDHQSLETFNKGLENPPEFTAENTAATFLSLSAQQGEIFARSLVNIFKALSWNYQSNKPVAFGKRLVMTYAVNEYRGGLSFEGRRKIADLDKAFHILDGKPPVDYLADAGAKADQGKHGDTIETDYFKFRLFKNRNLHVIFKRADLVDQANRMLAKHYGEVLPAPRD
jgi:hypothetical protein